MLIVVEKYQPILRTIKKQGFLLIMFCVLTLNASAQAWYNKHYDKSLSELNYEELYILSEFSRNTIRNGVILTTIGSGIMIGAGCIGMDRLFSDLLNWEYSGDPYYRIVIIAYYTGLAITAIGIPTIIVGSHRKKTIRNTMNNLQQNALIQIIPSVRYNNTVRGYCTGFTISMSF